MATPTVHVTDPLTTIFTPASFCSGVLYTFSYESDGTSVCWRDKDGPGDGSFSACYPPYFYDHHNPPSDAGTGAYSPAVCPTGYVAAFAETGRAGVVTSDCCPSGFTVSGKGCFSTVSTPTVIAQNPLTNASITGTWVAADWAVRVLWRTVDLTLFTPESAPLLVATPRNVPSTAGPSLGVSSTSMAAATSVSQVGSSQTESPPSSSLSTGAKAGIGVGVAVAVILIIVFVVFVVRHRRKRSVLANEKSEYRYKADDALASTESGSPEMNEQRQNAAQLDSTQIHEANGYVKYELEDSGKRRAELEGSTKL